MGKEKFSGQRLRRLFSPKSIVVVGGSWGKRVLEECQKSGYGGRLYAIHDEKDELAGITCLRRVQDLPEPPDACYLAVKHEKTIEIISGLNQMGAGGAVVFASGFAELGGAGVVRQEQLLKVCQHDKFGAMPFLGPNCYGIINMALGSVMWPDFHGLSRVDKGVAIITQSGNIAINLTMQKRGLPINYIMTMGNQAMVGISDVMRVVADDPATRAIGLHIEGFGDINEFIQAVQYCHQLGKAVVVLKTGLSDKGAELTMSHTASLAGGGEAAKAFLKKIGVPCVAEVTEFLEMLKLTMAFGVGAFGFKNEIEVKDTMTASVMKKTENKPGIRILSFSCSGGEATLMADLAAVKNELVFPPLSESAKKNLAELHGDKVSLNNPFDYQTYIWGNETALKNNFSFALDTPVDYGILILDIPNRPDMDVWAWRQTYEAFVAACKNHKRRGIILSSMTETLPSDEICFQLLDSGIAPIAGFELCIKLLPQLHLSANYYQPIGLNKIPKERDKNFIATKQARIMLEQVGLVFPKSQLVNKNNIDAVIKNFPKPIVMKAEGLAHKTEKGGVKLNITDDNWTEAATALFALSPEILLEEMIIDKKLELIIGLERDQALGLMLVVGEGGILTELRRDQVFIPLPTNTDEIKTALNQLRIAPLLLGYRNLPVLDIDAVIHNCMALNDFAIKYQNQLMTLDINPLLVSETRALAVDQLLVLAD